MIVGFGAKSHQIAQKVSNVSRVRVKRLVVSFSEISVSPISIERPCVGIRPEEPTAGFMMHPVVESVNDRALKRLGIRTRGQGDPQSVEIQRSHRSAGTNPK